MMLPDMRLTWHTPGIGKPEPKLPHHHPNQFEMVWWFRGIRTVFVFKCHDLVKNMSDKLPVNAKEFEKSPVCSDSPDPFKPQVFILQSCVLFRSITVIITVFPRPV